VSSGRPAPGRAAHVRGVVPGEGEPQLRGPEPEAPGRPGPLPVVMATSFLRAVRQGLESGAGLADALARGGDAASGESRLEAARSLRRLGGSYEEDEWGLDREFVESVRPLLDFMYDGWWRVETTGVRNVPATGRALLVANHAGIVPWDATMMALAVLREHPAARHPRFLVLDWAFRLPYVSVAIRKLGGVVASPYNAQRLLEEDRLVAVFPEGVKGASKDFKDRYRLQRFGRGGFIEIALRTGAPIIPVAVVGSEEIHPKIGEASALARLTGAPYFPITPTFPALGPLGAVPLPSKWRIEFCDPIDLSGYGPAAAGDRTLAFELSEQVRATIQDKVYENLVKRGSAFL
jgi:1-acyl-sn-glycerol-3-phosphate acyltransferase